MSCAMSASRTRLRVVIRLAICIAPSIESVSNTVTHTCRVRYRVNKHHTGRSHLTKHHTGRSHLTKHHTGRSHLHQTCRRSFINNILILIYTYKINYVLKQGRGQFQLANVKAVESAFGIVWRGTGIIFDSSKTKIYFGAFKVLKNINMKKSRYSSLLYYYTVSMLFSNLFAKLTSTFKHINTFLTL